MNFILRSFLLIALSLTTEAVAQQDTAVVERDTCEGEICVIITKLRVVGNVALYDRDSEHATIFLYVPAGAELTVLTTSLHHDPPGAAVALLPVVAEDMNGADTLWLAPGDTLAILGYRGEGIYGVAWQGRRYEIRAFWPELNTYPFETETPGRLLRSPHTHVWHKVRTADGREGWLFADPFNLEYLDPT